MAPKGVALLGGMVLLKQVGPHWRKYVTAGVDVEVPFAPASLSVTLTSLLVGCEMYNSQLPSQHHVCLHCAPFLATMDSSTITDRIFETVRSPLQLSVFIYRSSCGHGVSLEKQKH